jgi:hypothetical protein
MKKQLNTVQDGFKPGETQSTSEEGIGESNFGPLARTIGRWIITREDQNKNQEPRET